MKRRVEGSFLRIQCVACTAEFSHFIFSGDTDVVTADLASASSTTGRDLVLGIMTNDEFAAGDEAGRLAFTQRACDELGRDDLKQVHAIRSIDCGPSGAGNPFQAFRAAYRPPIIVYQCIVCDVGEAMEFTGRFDGNLFLLNEMTLAAENG